jgi:hypothetical protein
LIHSVRTDGLPLHTLRALHCIALCIFIALHWPNDTCIALHTDWTIINSRANFCQWMYYLQWMTYFFSVFVRQLFLVPDLRFKCAFAIECKFKTIFAIECITSIGSVCLCFFVRQLFLARTSVRTDRLTWLYDWTETEITETCLSIRDIRTYWHFLHWYFHFSE